MNSKIKKIIEDFNWDNVHKTMVALNWTNDENYVPSIGCLIIKAHDLMNAAINEFDKNPNKEYKAGFDNEFQVTYDGKMLKLCFVVDTAYFWDIEEDTNES